MRTTFEPVLLVRAGLRSLYDTSVLVRLAHAGPEGMTQVRLTDHLARLDYHSIYVCMKRLTSLGLVVKVGTDGKPRPSQVWVITKRGLKLLQDHLDWGKEAKR